ncbi:MAG: flagellar hook-length control protein FliK [Bacteroides sp.]|nr:flagellar hook-length control protein FliK [Bacteroides sp.]MCM1550013.1 flagellar hook-length control protein FliK [Clostridium sp.]
MQTEKTNSMNLITTVLNGRAAGKKEPSLTETFQSYVAQGSQPLNQQNRTTELSVKQENKTVDGYHQDAYEKNKLHADVYGAKVEQTDVSEEALQPEAEASGMEGDVTEEELETLESDIRTLLKKELDMDDAELDEWLAVMNLNVFQLLQPDTLQEFLLTVTETEPVDLLTNSDLIDTFRQIQGEMEQLQTTEDGTKLDLTTVFEQNTQKPETEGMTIIPEETELVPEAPVLETEAEELPTARPENRKAATEREPDNSFTVREESTGIEVSVKVEHSEKKDADAHSGQPEQTQQGIAGEIVNQLSQAVNELEDGPRAFSNEVQQADILRQVIEQIKVFSSSDVNRLEVQLYPQHLGRLQIQIMMKNGTMTAQIMTETEMAKNAIENQLQQLKETFREQSMKVDAVEVSVATSDFQKEQERQDSAGEQKGSRSGRSRLRMDAFGMPEDGMTEEEQIAAERLEAQGASVEFTA